MYKGNRSELCHINMDRADSGSKSSDRPVIHEYTKYKINTWNYHFANDTPFYP